MTHSGTVQIDGSGRIYQSTGNLTLTSAISGDKLILDPAVGCMIDLAGAGNTQSATDIGGGGYVQVTGAGALGSGTVTLLGGGRLDTNPAVATDSVFGSIPAVVANDGGTLVLGSTETGSAKIVLTSGGGLKHDDGNTVLDYSASGNVQASAGSVMDVSLDDSDPQHRLPTAGQLLGSGTQVYQGVVNATFPAGTYTVGPGGSNIFVGLSTMNKQATLDAAVTVNEDTAGQGFTLRAGGNQTLNLSGATLNGSGALELVGAGMHSINSPLAGTINTINYRGGSGRLHVAGAGGLRDTDTLNVHGGYLTVGHVQALGSSTGATVNVKSGGAFDIGLNISRGDVTFEAGSAARASSARLGGGAAFTFQGGSQIYIPGAPVHFTSNLPNADVSYSYDSTSTPHTHWWDLGAVGTATVYLGDAGRIAMELYVSQYIRGGDIMAAGGATSGRIATSGGADSTRYLQISNKINFPSETLIIGDTSQFAAYRGSGNWTNIDQDGRVYLANTANVIDQIRVEAGTLWINNATGATLGGADVRLANGAQLQIRTSTTLTNQDITGSGTITRYGNSALTMDAGALNPGSNPTAGVLEVGSYGLYFAKATGTPQVVIDVTGDGAAAAPAAGRDFDQLDVNTSLNHIGNADLVVNIPIPSKNFTPANLVPTDTLTIITCTNDLSAASFASELINTIDDAKNHWSGTVSYNNQSVTLNLDWTAHKGDADLNDEVDVLDLAKLANNFGRKDAGVNWGVADFDLNGEVDVLDLAAIANAFGWKVTGGSTALTAGGEGGGAPVPEPASAVLVVLGGLALIRRRRR